MVHVLAVFEIYRLRHDCQKINEFGMSLVVEGTWCCGLIELGNDQVLVYMVLCVALVLNDTIYCYYMSNFSKNYRCKYAYWKIINNVDSHEYLDFILIHQFPGLYFT